MNHMTVNNRSNFDEEDEYIECDFCNEPTIKHLIKEMNSEYFTSKGLKRICPVCDLNFEQDLENQIDNYFLKK